MMFQHELETAKEQVVLAQRERDVAKGLVAATQRERDVAKELAFAVQHEFDAKASHLHDLARERDSLFQIAEALKAEVYPLLPTSCPPPIIFIMN
jgi:hypothetical protein